MSDPKFTPREELEKLITDAEHAVYELTKFLMSRAEVACEEPNGDGGLNMDDSNFAYMAGVVHSIQQLLMELNYLSNDLYLRCTNPDGVGVMDWR